MKKPLCFFGLSLCVMMPVIAQHSNPSSSDTYQLAQVFVLSRHNLRTPFTWNNASLAKSTPNTWPTWSDKSNELTQKGGALETYMGHYFHTWLQKEGLFSQTGCPQKEDIYIYANRRQRTIATARFFAAGAFPACDIPIHHQAIPDEDTWASMDPIFNYPITNQEEAFKALTLKGMAETFNQFDLAPAYRLVESVMDYKNSAACKTDKKCSLTAEKNSFSAEPGNDPSISGSLKIGNAISEALIMEYYEGFPLKEITWGKTLNKKEWQLLLSLRNAYQAVQFSNPVVSQNLAKPLLSYLGNALFNTPVEKAPKLTILVGHDTNIATLLSALNVHPYQLPNQYESTPIGGKLVFQRWVNKEKLPFLKVEYIYQSADQLRNAEKLTQDQPAQRLTLSFKACPTNAEGFCPWGDFEKILKPLM